MALTLLPAALANEDPQAQGRLKTLWDAVRSIDPNTAPQPVPTLGTATIAAQPMPELPPPPPAVHAPAPDAALPPPPPAIPPAVMGTQGGMPALPSTAPAPIPIPPESPIPPTPSAFPADARVNTLQGKLDSLNAAPTLKQRLVDALPLIAAGATAAIARGNSGAIFGGVAKGEEFQQGQKELERQSLTGQLASSTQEREREYDMAQRTREMAAQAHEQAESRRDTARILGSSRENVANTNAGAKETVANTQGATARAVADTRSDASKKVAGIAANARIVASKYAADAANGRLTREINAGMTRQQRGFDFSTDKPTADEDRRADLAKSFSDIADEVADIVRRRPDLVGPLAGRETGLKAMIGTDDPDIANLNTDREAIGQIMLGAHSMRSAQHIEAAANSVFNAFHNGPDAMLAAIEQGKSNANTMQTITRPTLVNKVGGKGAGASTTKPSGKANDPLGIR